MIIPEIIQIGERQFFKQYSDLNVYIEREGVLYSEAIDPIEMPREYTETDIPLPPPPEPPEEVQTNGD